MQLQQLIQTTHVVAWYQHAEADPYHTGWCIFGTGVYSALWIDNVPGDSKTVSDL